ncbi:MAG TPA: hypothetical protein V6C81_06765 [Planktothrix sp.]|jgi:hypothetical protein
MLEELFESLTGPVGLGVLLLMAFPGGRQAARSSVKFLMRTGMEIGDYLGEIKEEVQAERNFYAKGQITDTAKSR